MHVLRCKVWLVTMPLAADGTDSNDSIRVEEAPGLRLSASSPPYECARSSSIWRTGGGREWRWYAVGNGVRKRRVVSCADWRARYHFCAYAAASI